MDTRSMRTSDEDGDPVVAPVQPVSGHVRITAGHHEPPRDGPRGSREAPPVTFSDLLGPIAFLRGPILVFLASIPVGIVFGDIGWIVMLLAASAGALRILDRRAGFSFADGLIGPRLALGWPRGVQEDDDFHWTWGRRPAQVRSS
jgi:hypothetical protein